MSEAEWIDVTSGVAASFMHERMTKPLPVVPIGLKAIDGAMMGWGMRKGLPRGTHAIVAGASNIGKTQIGLHLARQAANRGERAGFISLDMKKRNALLRVHMALVPEIDFRNWQPDRWRPEYDRTLRDGLARWRESVTGDVGISAPPKGDIDGVCRTIEEGCAEGVTFFVLDHLQKITVPGTRHVADRAEAVSDAIEYYCRAHNVTVIGLSQLNREAARQRDRTPIIQDILGGTSLEANAEVIIMLDHSRYARDRIRHHLGRTWVVLDKNQLGPKGFEVAVEVNHATLEYREAEPDEIGIWPVRDNKRRG
jgi:replicative DNA helicase